MQLPFEVLAIVFTHLPPKDLDNVKFVCREWRDVAGDRMWKQRFEHQYGTTDITRVNTSSVQWRREFLMRQAVLLKWRRCVKDVDITSNTTLSDVSNMFPNFTTDAARVICFNTHTGMGNLWDLDRGKLRRRLYASKYSHQVLPIASIDGSRFGLVYGFYNGEVATISLSRDGTIVADYNDLPYRHDTAVTALWVAKQRQLAKSPKRLDSAAVVASGSTDGTVFLSRPGLFRKFRPTDSSVVLLEGTMYGSYTRNDGNTVVCLDILGTLTLLDITAEPRHLAKLPFSLETVQRGIELHMANDFVVVQTETAIYVVDIHTAAVHTLLPPADHRICTFGIDKSYTTGTKYIAAGFSNNEISLWALPQVNETSVVKIDNSNALGSPAMAQPDRELQETPLWTLPNPIGYDHRLETSGKSQITQLALNAAVLLVAGYNGMVMAMDVLSGQPLKRVSSRISKNVLDLMLYSRDGFVPVTHLEIDPNPLNFRAIIATRPAIQFVDLGPLDTKQVGQRQAPRQRRGTTPHVSTASRQDLDEEIALRREFAELDAEREASQRALRESFSMGDLGEDEQMEYALMLSEQASAAHAANTRDEGEDEVGSCDEDEELRRVLELSRLEEQQTMNLSEVEQALPSEMDEEIDDELRRAIEQSLIMQ